MAKKESKAEDLIRRHTRSRRQAVGFFLCLLALIGLVSLVLGGVRLTQNILDDSEERKAYEQRYMENFTDDASVVEAMGEFVHVVEGNRENIKITTPFDFVLAKAIVECLTQQPET